MNKQRNKTSSRLAIMAKLARSKNYIVITDDEAFMNIAVNNNLDDVVKYSSQMATLEQFRDALDNALRNMDKALTRFLTIQERKSTRKQVKKG